MVDFGQQYNEVSVRMKWRETGSTGTQNGIRSRRFSFSPLHGRLRCRKSTSRRFLEVQDLQALAMLSVLARLLCPEMLPLHFNGIDLALGLRFLNPSLI